MPGMFGSEDPSMMAGGTGQQFGGNDLMMAEMLRNVPELRKRQRQAEALRGLQKEMQAQGQGGPQQNYTGQSIDGGLFQTVQKYQPDYAALGKQAIGAIGGYMGEAPAAAAEGAYDDLQSSELMRAMQQYGGGNAGGRMSEGSGTGAGLDAASAGAGNGYGFNSSAGTVPLQPGVVPGRQNAAMALRGNRMLGGMPQWFGG